jgi:hypothetical protein
MTTKPRGRQQAADPADRALRAAEECRAATREAHEAIQGYKDLRAAAADLRAAIAEARNFLSDEIKAQLDAAGPATKAELDARVEDVTTYFVEQLRAKYASIVAAQPNQQSDAAALLPGMTCPYCEKVNDSQIGIKTKDDDRAFKGPRKGSMSICATCHEVAVYDTDPATGTLVLRKPTLTEAKGIAQSRLLRNTIAAATMARAEVDTDRALKDAGLES